MKVTINNDLERPSTLHLEPENDRDRQVLESIMTKFQTAGFGRNAHTLKIIHVQLPLIAKE